MVRRNDPTIDEEALRQAIGRQSSHGSVLRTPEDPTTDDEPAPPPEAAASEACEPRRRRLRMPDYEQTFLCDHDVRHRSNLYASEEIKRKLLDVVQLLGRGNLSLTAYVDNMLRMKSSSRYPVPRRSATLTQAQQRPTLDRGEPRVYSQPSANPYVRCFLRARLLSSRHAVYIDTNVHDTLWRVVRACGVRNITLSSYVDAIVREHLERYRTQIEALHAPDDENSRTRCSS